MNDSRLARLADVLVNYSVRVRPDDLVLVRATTVAERLVLEICRAVVEAGGRPHIRLWPEEYEELLLKHGRPRQLAAVNPILVHEMKTVDCMIAVWGGRNTRFLAGVDPKKQARLQQSRRPLLDLLMSREAARRRPLRWVGTQYPCDSAAQDADMSTADFADFVFRAGFLHKSDPAAEWRKLSVAQQRLCDFLGRSRQLRFRHPDGTDLRVGVAGRRWINCDGANNFPDGEVFTGPIEDGTDGVVQYRFPALYGGREAHDVRLVFRAGRVVDCSASRGEDFLTQMLDQDPGARRLGEIAIGTNYHIDRYMRNTLFDEKIGGTFHAALGAAYTKTGGRNKSALHWDMVCDLRRGGVIEADGRVISRDGRFTNRAWPRP